MGTNLQRATTKISSRIIAVLNSLAVSQDTTALNAESLTRRLIDSAGIPLTSEEELSVQKTVSSILSSMYKRKVVRRTSKRVVDGKYGYYLHTKPFEPADTIESRIQHADAVEKAEYEKVSAPAKIRELMTHLSLSQLTELLSAVSLKINDNLYQHEQAQADLKNRVAEQQSQIELYQARILPLAEMIRNKR